MFIHEMWHVKQMIDKRLSFNSEHTKAYWNGNEYTSDLSHDDREWEKEARQAKPEALFQRGLYGRYNASKSRQAAPPRLYRERKREQMGLKRE
jgi:hypothetical protein